MFAVTTKECIHCRQTGIVMVDPEKYIEFTQTPRHLRRLVQDIFPDTSKELREQLMTGVHPECFEEMFGGEGE
jgi:hypothetical protein